MDDDTLSKYIEEAHQTLFSDYHYEKMMSSLVSEIGWEGVIRFPFSQIDQLLPGHPKLIMNKGRIGWGEEELYNFAPEFKPSFQLRWVAVRRELCLTGVESESAFRQLLLDALTETEMSVIEVTLGSHWRDEYRLLPVHPWQWNRYIKIQFFESLAVGDIVDLGFLGDLYSPQASLRTLSNQADPKKLNVKLSVSILNTSCVRGVPLKYIEKGHQISEFVAEILAGDELLKNVRVLKESAALAVPHRGFNELVDASYRYKELFGCVWRESVESKLEFSESAIPVAALLMRNEAGSYMAKTIELSGLTAAEWLKLYFENVVVPLYRLQLRHGLGLVAHGQNTILILQNFRPSGLIIKDFHGDLRVSSSSPYLKRAQSLNLETLPPEYLIHDLITGHLITVLRYMSRILSEAGQVKEVEFYQILSRVVTEYFKEHGERISDARLNLLRPEFEKVIVNKVRFVAGYSETAQRLKPLLGELIPNPLTLNTPKSELFEVHNAAHA